MAMSTTRHASEVGIFSGAVGGGRLESGILSRKFRNLAFGVVLGWLAPLPLNSLKLNHNLLRVCSDFLCKKHHTRSGTEERMQNPVEALKSIVWPDAGDHSI